MRTTRLLVTLLSMLVATVAVGSPARADISDWVDTTVDDVVRRQLAEQQIPGAAVVVVADGRQVFAKGYGVADRSTGAVVDAGRTRFFMGSVAKLFTAEAVLRLAESGRLDLDADVNTYLTDLAVEDSYPGRPVTLRHLLTHTSGFADTPLGVAVADPADAPPLGAWLRAHQPPRVRPPGTLPAYDNYGFALAGHVVETVAGMPFADYVDAHVLGPLGMTATTFAQPPSADARADLARGYRADGVEARGQYGAMGPTGAGAITTATDMGRYLLAALRPGNPLTTPQSTPDPRMPGMGFGFEQHRRGGLRLVTKDGDVPGFHSNLALLPEAGVGVFVSYNGDGRDGAAAAAGRELVERVVERVAPAGAPPATTPGTGLDAYEGDYRTTRYSRTDFTKLTTLTGAVSVRVDGDGLVTTGLSATERRWRQVEPGLFTDGRETIAFRDGVLFASANPSVAYERLPWYGRPAAHLAVAAAALLVLVVSLVWWPVAALVRRRSRSGRLPRLAVLAGWTTAGLLVAFAVLLGAILGDGAALDERVFLGDSPLLAAALVLPAVAVLTTAAMLAATVAAWLRGWWRRAGRIGYTAATAAAVALLGVAATYQLVG